MSGSYVFLICLAALLVIVVVGAVLMPNRVAKKSNAVRAWAVEHGHSYVERDDTTWVGRWDFAPFNVGRFRHADNVVTGQWDDRPFTVFDYQDETGTSNVGAAGGASSDGRVTWRHAVCVLTLSSAARRLVVTQRSRTERIVHHSGSDDVRLGNDTFDRQYDVDADDPAFATAALPTSAVESLLVHPVAGLRIEGNEVISWTKSSFQDPAEMPDRLNTLAIVARSVDGA
jgi:hypothetical protein